MSIERNLHLQEDKP